MKNAIQKVLGRFGYGLRKLSRLQEIEEFNPFIRTINFPDAHFQMWIANRDDITWYEPETWQNFGELAAMRKLAKKGAHVLEVGSHHGFTAMILSNLVGPSGRVYSIEAHPGNAKIAEAQLALNPSIKNVSFVNFACSDVPGTVQISSSHNSSVTQSSEKNTIAVKAVTGDMLDESHGPFDFIKIDVEGYELEVLQGCRHILSRRPRISLELHLQSLQERGHTVQEILDLIGIEDYEGEMVVRPNNPHTLIPFDIFKVPGDSIVNAFLTPKS